METYTRGIFPFTNTNTVEKIKRGFFMGGSITADQKSCACGSTKWKRINFEGFNVQKCATCESWPKYFRIRRYLPVPNSKRGKTFDLRYDDAGKRLTNIHRTIAFYEGLDHKLQTGQLDTSKYIISESNNPLRFDNYVNKTYLPLYNSKLKLGEVTKNTMRIKNQLLKNYILPAFGDYQLHQISSMKLEEFYYKLPRQRDMATAEIKVILKLAHKHEQLKDLPKFPKIKKANFRKAETFITPDQQKEIISQIENFKHKAMIEILATYGMRPCEVRALKWKDVNFELDELTISRHCTDGGEVIEGRKSNSEGHTVPLTGKIKTILDSIESDRHPDEFIFKGERLQVVSERVLLRAWQRAIAKTDIPYVDLYAGTKHSKLTSLLEKGYSESEIIALSGHTSVAMIRRYAQLNKKSKLAIARKMLDENHAQ